MLRKLSQLQLSHAPRVSYPQYIPQYGDVPFSCRCIDAQANAKGVIILTLLPEGEEDVLYWINPPRHVVQQLSNYHRTGTRIHEALLQVRVSRRMIEVEAVEAESRSLFQ